MYVANVGRTIPDINLLPDLQMLTHTDLETSGTLLSIYGQYVNTIYTKIWHVECGGDIE